MKRVHRVITCASWEERFYLGIEKILRDHKPDKIIMFYYQEYASRTKENREKVKKLCKRKKLSLFEKMIDFESPEKAWVIFKTVLLKENLAEKNVLLDFTTMPRDAIYSILSFLEYLTANIIYIYFRPKKYNKKWLSRDPDKPRLIFKHSGVTDLDKKTALVVITGYDAERTEQLIKFFEPSLTLIGFQQGKQFDNDKQNISKHKKHIYRWKAETEIRTFSLDAYSKDHGFNIIQNQIKKYFSKFNIIISSLGPKPSAIAIYKIVKQYPMIAIAYAPSKEFNPEYSYGIGRKISGKYN